MSDPVQGGYFTTERRAGPDGQPFFILKVYTRHGDLLRRAAYSDEATLREDTTGYQRRGAHSRSLPVQRYSERRA